MIGKLNRSTPMQCFESHQIFTILTPSPLRAGVAAQQFSQYQLSRGIESWERPAIYSLSAWLAACWQEARYRGAEHRTLLSPPQERVLWQRIVEQHHPNLFDSSATAALAQRSANLIAEWHLPLHSNLWSENLDSEQFLVWYRAFRATLCDECWISRSDLWGLVPEWIHAGYIEPGQIVFAGFAATAPALQELRQALGNRAIDEPMNATREFGDIPAKSCADLAEELKQAARWARATFERQPSRSIGVFVPDLASQRLLVQRTFERVFYPSSALRGRSSLPAPFHIAAKAPLVEHPLIAGALLLLKTAHPGIAQADASAILRSPFISGASEERSARALADLRLRRLRELEVSLDQLQQVTVNCPSLPQLWQAVRRLVRNWPSTCEPAVWTQTIGNLLEALGWPGEQELTTEEQDALESWKHALSTFASLGIVTGPVSYDAALTHLRRLLAHGELETGDWFSPIQILDSSDAAGLKFDSAFVTGLSEETWPPRPNASALVPWKLQRAHQIPGSSPQSMQRDSERLTRSLFLTAPVALSTYSGRLAPVAERFVKKDSTIDFRVWKGKLARESYPKASLDELADIYAPPYRPTGETRGGTSIIKAQSQCPFRAYAERRLNAVLPEDGCFGLDARDRGGNLHKALQYVWQEVQTRDRLKAIDNAELRLLVADAVGRTVQDDKGSPFTHENHRAERERLEELILDWLHIERGRRQPFVVELMEQERQCDIAGLPLRLRIDRVDRLPNGNLILIDYKSGQTNRNDLKGDRPSEPQLLVYAAALGSDVDGIFFGQLKARDLRGVGYSREEQFAEKTAEVRRDWDSFMQQSRVNVERISLSFQEGFAAVDPLREACDFCMLQPLCRIAEVKESEDAESE